MHWTRYKPSKRSVFALLMLLSGVSLFLVPAGWTDALKHVGQLAVPGADPLYGFSHDVAASLSDLDPASDADRIERQALLHELASQVAITRQLRDENARLRNLRNGYIPASLPLLPARVVARDIVAWRDAFLVERGSARGVRRKDWVASRFFVNRGRVAAVEEGQVVLARECLLGRIEQVSPYMARVQLLSDVDSPRLEVRLGTRTANAFERVDYPCSLRGLGRGRMIVEDVPYRYVQALADHGPGESKRLIRVGDLVFTAEGRLGLPVPLVIGKVTALEEDPKKRLVVSLIVEPIVSIDQVRDVIIIPLVPIDRIPLNEP